MAPAPEIDPEALEREIAAGVPLVLIDLRDEDSFAAWQLDAPPGVVRNVPDARFDSALEGVLAATPDDARVRLICASGRTSLARAGTVARLRPGAASVHGGMIGWSRLLVHDDVPLPGPARVAQFRREARGCLSYLIESDGQALVVDPAPDVEAYRGLAARLNARIVAVFDTHVHADHLSGGRELARAGGAPLMMSGGALRRGVADPDALTPLADGDRIEVGRADVRMLALPGHTTDMAGLLVDGAALVGGDSLFADSVARPDLEAGDSGAAEAARVLHRTIHERILALSDSVRLLPCHYPGGRRQGPLAPTLGEVRAAVAELRLDESEFVRRVTASMPPRPANHEQIIAVNLGRGAPGLDAPRLEVGANNCAIGSAA
ncbi:MAG TPA: MBL fold metallo-hydrolase [Gaiellales bacterium]|nr:MBL fold metallo-hydrolase [Gaiellales bacterium]